jgi:polysaccharide deacetylase family protein (PEP-CTERM system associated)
MQCVFSVDVEDWYHILDAAAAPNIEAWPQLESRVERNMSRLLDMLAEAQVKGTFFWLGWMAERCPSLLRSCSDAGHEIASHGYAHVLPFQVGQDRFAEDLLKGKGVLEDLTGRPVHGFRAPGFGVRPETKWFFEAVRRAGFAYDSSIFPGRRGHGGMADARLDPHVLRTEFGELAEFPITAVEVGPVRLFLFGGGYLRLAPPAVLQWGLDALARTGRPLIIYVHPRDIDAGQPRLPLPIHRRFKSYVGLAGAYSKLKRLLAAGEFRTMGSLSDELTAARLISKG